MNKKSSDLSIHQAAWIAGLGYLLIIVLAVFAEFFIRSRLLVPGNPAATTKNIVASEGLFRVGICSYLIVAVTDLLIAWALYVFLRPVNRSLSLLAAWFRVAHAIILGIALTSLLGVLQLLSGLDYLAAISTAQLSAQVMLSFDAFNDGWLIGLVFFGVHCLILGYLILRSDYVPPVLGMLLILAALGYLIDSFAHFLLPDYASYQTVFLVIVAVPAIIAELTLCLWLLWKGRRAQVVA